MKMNAEDVIAGFYYFITNSQNQSHRGNEAAIHKLNYQILFNQTPTTQDWAEHMVAYAVKFYEPQQAEAVKDILRKHYNTLVPENMVLTSEMFEAITQQRRDISN